MTLLEDRRPPGTGLMGERLWCSWEEMKEPLRLLFLCSRNRLRSPTAEAVFGGEPGLEVASAGLSPDAEEVVTEDLVRWADVILVMEPVHRERLKRKFGRELAGKRVEVLGIRDDYEYMDPELVALLRARCARYLR